MAGSPDRTELQRRLLAQKGVNQWYVWIFRSPFYEVRKDLKCLPASVSLSLRYYVALAEMKPRLIPGRGCGTKATLVNMGYLLHEAVMIAANMIHYGRISLGGQSLQWINFSLHSETSQAIVYKSTQDVMHMFNRDHLSSLVVTRPRTRELEAGGQFEWGPDGFGRLDPTEASSSAVVIVRFIRRAAAHANEARAKLELKEAALKSVASRGEIAVNLKFEEIQGISTSSVHAEFKSTICGRLCEPSNWKTNRAAVLARSSSADANVLTCVDSLLDDFGKDLSEKLALEASQIIEELTAKHNKELDDIKQQWCIAEQKVSLAEVDLCVCRLKRDEMLDVDEICRRDTGFTVEERRKVDKLIQKATELHSGRIDGSFKIYRKEFWPMPAPFKGDGDLSKTQLKVKAALLRDGDLRTHTVAMRLCPRHLCLRVGY